METTITGTDKQVAWANDIRREQLAAVTAWIAENTGSEAMAKWNPTEEQVAAALAHYTMLVGRLEAQASASWWIDNRTATPHNLLHLAQEVLGK